MSVHSGGTDRGRGTPVATDPSEFFAPLEPNPGRHSPWLVPRGPPNGPMPALPVAPMPRYSSPVVLNRPPLCAPADYYPRGTLSDGSISQRGTPTEWLLLPPSASPIPSGSFVSAPPARVARPSHAHAAGDPVTTKETWVAFTVGGDALWFDDNDGGHLCAPCGRKVLRAYDGVTQLGLRIKREQLVQGALQSAIQSLHSLCLGDVTLEEVLGQHWAQMRLQFDVITILLENHPQGPGDARCQEIKRRLSEFKRLTMERMKHFRLCPADASRERLQVALAHLQADNRRLLEDVETLHSANALLEADIEMLSARLEKTAKKAFRAARAEVEAEAGATTEPLQRALAEANAHRRRVEQERDVLELEAQRLQQDVVEGQRRNDDLLARLQQVDLELLSARPRHSDPPPVDPAIETLAAENVALRGQMAVLQAEVDHLKAQAADGTSRLLRELDNGLHGLKPPAADRDRDQSSALEAERERRQRAEQRMDADGRELEALRQEVTAAQVECLHLNEAIRVKDAEVVHLRRRLEAAAAHHGDAWRTAELTIRQKEHEQALQDLLDTRSRSIDLETQTIHLRNELRAARRTVDLQAEQLSGTLTTLAHTETELTEAQTALHHARRTARDQQFELKALWDEVQLRRSRGSGRSTPVPGSSPCPPAISPGNPGHSGRCVSPAVSPAVAAILRGYRGSRSEGGGQEGEPPRLMVVSGSDGGSEYGSEGSAPYRPRALLDGGGSLRRPPPVVVAVSRPLLDAAEEDLRSTEEPLEGEGVPH